VLILTGVPVQITGVGIDLFALLLAGSLLFLVERTVGDGVAELIGPVGAATLFCAIAAAGFGYMLTATGQAQGKRVMAIAQSHGYQPLYFKSASPEDEKDRRRQPIKPAGLPAREPKPASPDVALATATPADRKNGVEPAASSSGPPPAVVTPGLLGLFKTKELPLARLIVTPRVVSSSEPVRLELRFVGPPVTLTGSIAFLVNGREIARAEPDASGAITAQTREIIPGPYEASARLPGGTRATPPGAVSFTVLPPRRR
jgi:hypothetical protein